VDRWVDPGSHEVAVRTSSGVSSARTITLAEGSREEVVFSLEPVVRVPVTAPRRSPAGREPASASSEGARPRTLGWVTLGTGAALTGAGAVLGVLALGHKSELDAACKPGCPPDYQDDIDTYRLERNLSYVGFALGAAFSEQPVVVAPLSDLQQLPAEDLGERLGRDLALQRVDALTQRAAQPGMQIGRGRVGHGRENSADHFRTLAGPDPPHV
jgi:hypothetical protein